MTKEIDTLNSEWLDKYRDIECMTHIYESREDSFLVEEIAWNFYRKINFRARLIDEMEIDETREWDISLETGKVFYVDQD